MNRIPITIIVPVYKVGAYIERCSRSLFSQTLSDLEILFINDCSPDDSIETIKRVLCDFPHRKQQVRFINMTYNSGQAAVRKRGIIEAKGNYIIHCDGDDWVDNNLYQMMYDRALAMDADIVVCDEMLEYNKRTVLNRIDKLPNHCQDLIRDWYKRPLGMFCHNKLIKKSLYLDHGILPWDGLNMWEDNGLMARLFYFGGTLAQIHGPVYHYNRTNVTAITASYGEKQVEQMIGIAERLTRFFYSHDDAVAFQKTVQAFQFLAKINLITDSWPNLRRYYQVFPGSESIATELSKSAFSSRGKLRFFFVKWHIPGLFVLLYKIFHLLKWR